MIVGVIGGNTVSEETYRKAEFAGRLIASRGHILVCGGLSGVMEAACRGAKKEGGITTGILPGNDTKDANPYVAVPVATGMGIARNTIIIRTSDILIAIDGAYGTLTEIATALNMGKKVIAFDSWNLQKAGEVDPELYIQVGTNEMLEKTFIKLTGEIKDE